jgi:hypothetical protein
MNQRILRLTAGLQGYSPTPAFFNPMLGGGNRPHQPSLTNSRVNSLILRGEEVLQA